MNIENFRKEYTAHALDEADVSPGPVLQFERWFEEALAARLPEPNAMTLATADASGRPSARIVLLKGFGEEGFSFFTNYQSRKGQNLAAQPWAALVFFWQELQRQVRIEGIVEKLSPEESTAYFQSRPRGSQAGAWASPQSQVIGSREVLARKMDGVEAQFAGQELLPRPPHWGGYLLRPALVEFWQGRPSRLHDRIQYTLMHDGSWKIERLAP